MDSYYISRCIHKYAIEQMGEFELGETVYLRTDPEQYEAIITSMTEYIGGSVTYTISCNGSTTTAYGIELEREINEVKRLGINQKQE